MSFKQYLEFDAEKKAQVLRSLGKFKH